MPRAIDIHVHPATEEYIIDAGGEHMKQAYDYFGEDHETVPIEETVQIYEDAGIETAVLFAWDAETNTGNPRVENEWVANICDEYDLFRGFASVDPHKGKIAEQEAIEAIDDLGLDGFKFQQAAQGFFPNDDAFDDLWDTLEELGKPALFHGGTTGYGAGGDSGIYLKYTKPIPYIDDVATEHPDLPIIIAHPAWPWHQEQLAVAMHKQNVYIDLSGWKPKYIPDEVLTYARSMISDKVLFGSDYPMLSPQEWLDGFEELDFPEEVQDKILYKNAKKLLDL